MRLDIVVSEKFSMTRNKAQGLIKNGLVEVRSAIIRKSSYEVIEPAEVQLRESKEVRWVSRSAGKLDGFIETLPFNLEIKGAMCLDVGSSTGGFSQVLLEHGAHHVDAVDVGTDQLHESLRNHPQISSFEQTDIRDFKSEEKYDIIVCDASFISLEQLLHSILRFADEMTSMLLLWKPQFEVGKENLRKTGVPKDEKTVMNFQKHWEIFLTENNCKILHKEKSTVLGEAGNTEWLYALKKTKASI